MVLTSLVKGARHFARVRVKNFLGSGAWNSTPTAYGLIFLSLASPPQLQFVGSGGDPDLTAVHTAPMKYLPYLNMLFDPSSDLGAGVGKNVSLSDIKKLVYIFDISTSALFDTGATWKIRWAQDEHALNKKSEMHLKVVANQAISLEFEIKYFVLVCTEIVKGFSNWSLTIPRILLKRPGPTESVNINGCWSIVFKFGMVCSHRHCSFTVFLSDCCATHGWISESTRILEIHVIGARASN